MFRVILLVFLLSGCNKVPNYQNPDDVELTIQSEYEINDDVLEAVHVIEDNLRYVEEEDMEGYVSTLVSRAREETSEELALFFEQYDLNITILSIEVLEQEESIMLIQTEQQTVEVGSVEDAPNYRDHIAEANHTLVKEDGEWKIEETIMTNTIFLE